MSDSVIEGQFKMKAVINLPEQKYSTLLIQAYGDCCGEDIEIDFPPCILDEVGYMYPTQLKAGHAG